MRKIIQSTLNNNNEDIVVIEDFVLETCTQITSMLEYIKCLSLRDTKEEFRLLLIQGI